MENDRYILRSITDEIMYEIMRLSGQEYVDMYAARAKEESKKRPEPARPPPSAEPDRARRRRPDPDSRPRGARPALVASRTGCSARSAVLRVVLLVNTVALNLYRARQLRPPGRRAWSSWP